MPRPGDDAPDRGTSGDGGPGAAGVTPRTARAHAFVTDVESPALSADDRHHLGRVLRLGPGSHLTVGDGAGRWRAVRLASGAGIEATGEIVADPRPRPAITVAFAVVKGDRPELAVQKLTEAGVDRIVPFVAARSVVRWDEAKADRQHARLTAIARQAAMQCRRTWLPTVDRVMTFAEATGLDGATLADIDGEPPTLALPTVLVGPEGGWSATERGSELPRTRVGSHVFRAETAAITAGTLLAALRDGLVMET